MVGVANPLYHRHKRQGIVFLVFFTTATAAAISLIVLGSAGVHSLLHATRVSERATDKAAGVALLDTPGAQCVKRLVDFR